MGHPKGTYVCIVGSSTEDLKSVDCLGCVSTQYQSCTAQAVEMIGEMHPPLLAAGAAQEHTRTWVPEVDNGGFELGSDTCGFMSPRWAD